MGEGCVCVQGKGRWFRVNTSDWNQAHIQSWRISVVHQLLYGEKRENSSSFKPNFAVFSLLETSHQVQLMHQDVNTRRQGSLGAILDAACHIDQIPLLSALIDQYISPCRTSVIVILYEWKDGLRQRHQVGVLFLGSSFVQFFIMALSSLDYELHEDSCLVLLIPAPPPPPAYTLLYFQTLSELMALTGI